MSENIDQYINNYISQNPNASILDYLQTRRFSDMINIMRSKMKNYELMRMIFVIAFIIMFILIVIMFFKLNKMDNKKEEEK